eukprot:jgi/Hompol1/258/HPOL_001147-RA
MSITRPSQWFQRQASDPFVKSRVQHNYRSRSAFKLKELVEKHRFIRPGDVVLDLGAAPGGWTQVALEAVNAPVETKNKSKNDTTASTTTTVRKGRAIAVDIMGIDPIPGADIIIGDVQSPLILQQIRAIALQHAAADPSLNTKAESATDAKQDELVVQPVTPVIDVLISDMAHPFSGHRTTDVARVKGLCEFALEIASHPWLLKRGGDFVCKFMRGEGETELKDLCKSLFAKVIFEKPKASRKDSSEAYLVCLGYKRKQAPK